MHWLKPCLLATSRINQPLLHPPQLCKLCIKQYPARNMRQQFKDLMSLVAEIKMKVKEGTHKTPVKVRVLEIVTVPMCVTFAIEPFWNFNMGRNNSSNGGKHRRATNHVISSSNVYNPSMGFQVCMRSYIDISRKN